jgi:flagellar biosynthesis chaperone FliJ
MKNKDVEDYVFKALEFFEKDRDPAIDQITKEAFAAHRQKGFDEVQIKRLNTYLETKDKEIREHKQAISNLRGYVGYLESQIDQLEKRLDEHEGNY